MSFYTEEQMARADHEYDVAKDDAMTDGKRRCRSCNDSGRVPSESGPPHVMIPCWNCSKPGAKS